MTRMVGSARAGVQPAGEIPARRRGQAETALPLDGYRLLTGACSNSHNVAQA